MQYCIIIIFVHLYLVDASKRFLLLHFKFLPFSLSFLYTINSSNLIESIVSALLKMEPTNSTFQSEPSFERRPLLSRNVSIRSKLSIRNAHYEVHSSYVDIIRDMIIGFADGLTVPFALTAGLSSYICRATVLKSIITEILDLDQQSWSLSVDLLSSLVVQYPWAWVPT